MMRALLIVLAVLVSFGAVCAQAQATGAFFEGNELHKLCTSNGSVRSGDQEASRRYGRKVSAAVDLYAQQASRGSFSGEQSLRFIAIELAKSKPLLESVSNFRTYNIY